MFLVVSCKVLRIEIIGKGIVFSRWEVICNSSNIKSWRLLGIV